MLLVEKKTTHACMPERKIKVEEEGNKIPLSLFCCYLSPRYFSSLGLFFFLQFSRI